MFLFRQDFAKTLSSMTTTDCSQKYSTEERPGQESEVMLKDETKTEWSYFFVSDNQTFISTFNYRNHMKP